MTYADDNIIITEAIKDTLIFVCDDYCGSTIERLFKILTTREDKVTFRLFYCGMMGGCEQMEYHVCNKLNILLLNN